MEQKKLEFASGTVTMELSWNGACSPALAVLRHEREALHLRLIPREAEPPVKSKDEFCLYMLRWLNRHAVHNKTANKSVDWQKIEDETDDMIRKGGVPW